MFACFDLWVKAAPDEMYVLSQRQAKDLGVVNNGRRPPEWSIASFPGGTMLQGRQTTADGTGMVYFSCDGKQTVFGSVYEAAGTGDAVTARGWSHSLTIDSDDAIPLEALAVSEQGRRCPLDIPLDAASDSPGDVGETDRSSDEAFRPGLTRNQLCASTSTISPASMVRTFLGNCLRAKGQGRGGMVYQRLIRQQGGAAMQTMKLGEVAISRVIEIDRSSFPTASMLLRLERRCHRRPPSLALPHFFDERTGDLASRIQTYVVKTPRHTILIDTGVGNDKVSHARSRVEHAGRYLSRRSRRAVGVTPEQVDFVVCTHLHVDHVGWNTRWQDGRWVPTFPNAKYVYRRRRVGVPEVRERIRQGRVGMHRRQRGASSSRPVRRCSSTATSRSASTSASSRGSATPPATSACA